MYEKEKVSQYHNQLFRIYFVKSSSGILICNPLYQITI